MSGNTDEPQAVNVADQAVCPDCGIYMHIDTIEAEITRDVIQLVGPLYETWIEEISVWQCPACGFWRNIDYAKYLRK